MNSLKPFVKSSKHMKDTSVSNDEETTIHLVSFGVSGEADAKEL